jgi:hypothetical protein
MWKSIESRKTAMTKLQADHEKANDQLQLRRDIFASKQAGKAGAGGATGAGGLSEKYGTDPSYKKNVDFWANILKTGGSLPPRFAQSGAGKVMMPDIINVVPTLGSGNPNEMFAAKLSQRQLTAEAQKIGTQSASVAIASAELGRFIPAAEKAIDAVPRTAWRPLNQLIQSGANTWSPEQKSLVIATRAVQTAFAQLIQRGAPTVHSSEEAEKMILTADSPDVYKAALKQLRVEAEQAELGLKDAHESLLKRAREVGKEGEAGGGATPPADKIKTGPNGVKQISGFDENNRPVTLELRNGAWVPAGGGAEPPAAIPIRGGRRIAPTEVPQ